MHAHKCSAHAFARRHASHARPLVEPIESRRLLTASLLSGSLDEPSDAQDVMASFDEFLRDQAARRFAPPQIVTPPSPAVPPASVVVRTTTVSPSRTTTSVTTTTTMTRTTTTTSPTRVTTTTAPPTPPASTPASTTSEPLPGDVNSDGRVDADDFALYDRGLARYESGAISPGAALRTDGDVTGDGIVNQRDYLVIYSAYTSVINYPPSAPAAPVLVPGPGFVGPAPQPPPVGSPTQQGYDETAIARWDVVPYQTFDTTLNVGVVAFHMNGIARVEFAVDGGAPQSVTAMTTNPTTGASEYFATLNAANFTRDGVVEVRAVAYPNTGTPRLLTPLFLNVNGQHTLPTLTRYVSTTGSNATGDGTQLKPYQTIKQAAMSIHLVTPEENVDDGTIYLGPGDYAFSGNWQGSPNARPLTEFAWLTISAAPGVPADQVRITVADSADRLNTSRVRLANLTVYNVGLVSNTNLNQPAAIWFDHCVLAGAAPTSNVMFAPPTAWTGGIFATDTQVHDAVNGLPAASLLRNVRVTRIQSDAFMNVQTLVNCSTKSIHTVDDGIHPDVVQFFSPAGTTIENRVIYGLTATSSVNAPGLFAGTGFSLKDIAIVDCHIDNSPNIYYAFQFCGPTRHMVVSRSSFMGALGGVWRTDVGFTATNVTVESTTFSKPINPAPGVTYL